MLSSVANITYSIAAYTTSRNSPPSEPSPSPLTSRENRPVDIRIIEPPDAAKLYLDNGLMAGERAPGGAGAANRIQLDGEDIAVSGKPVFPVNELPDISVRESHLFERVTEPQTEMKQEETRLMSRLSTTEWTSTYTLGGHETRAGNAYQTQADWSLFESQTKKSSILII